MIKPNTIFRMDSEDPIDVVCPECSKTVQPTSEGLCPECKAKIPTTDAKPVCACGKPDCKGGKDCSAPKKKDSVSRIDAMWSITPQDMQEAEMLGYVKTFKRDVNGFLNGKAPCTNIGVFTYKMPDGSIRREARLPEDVFAQDSLSSLKLVPLCNDHPKEAVTPDNAKKYVIGSIGDGVDYDAYKVYAPIVITDKDTIDAVESGKRALSCGYNCDIEEKAGNWMGVDYDVIQRNIRYNHVAVVDKGRAGDTAVMKLDGVDVPVGHIVTQQNKDHTMKIKLDSVEIEVDEKVGAAFNALSGKLDAAEKAAKDTTSAMQAKLDSAQDELKASKENLDAMPAMIESAVKARLDLVGQAIALGVEAKADQTDAAIKQAVILKAFPKADSAKLNDAVYLTHRFDAAIELLKDAPAKNDSAAASNVAVGTVTVDNVDAKASEKKYFDALKKNSCGNKK